MNKLFSWFRHREDLRFCISAPLGYKKVVFGKNLEIEYLFKPKTAQA